MAKESKHRKDVRKKPALTLKEKRAKKHEKKQHKYDHHVIIGDSLLEEF